MKLPKTRTTTNSGSFDDPRGLYSRSSEVRFGSPINMSQIVFAAMREPVAKRVVVDVAFDMMAKGFSVEEAAEGKSASLWEAMCGDDCCDGSLQSVC